MKNIIDFVSYASAISEATGYRRRSAFEKYGLVGAKFLFSVMRNRGEENLIKEIGQAGVSMLCNMGGRTTGDMQSAAQAELFCNATLDAATSATNYSKRRDIQWNNLLLKLL